MIEKNIKVVFDTNVWISFLMGKRLAFIKKHISKGQIVIVTSSILLDEIKEVTSREKLKKYFSQKSVSDLTELLEIIAEKFEVNPTNFIYGDPKDNFLLDLIEHSKADFLVTGDKDLLILDTFQTTKILSPADFESEIDFRNGR